MITTFLDPTQLPSRTQEQQIFDLYMGRFMQQLPIFGSEINAALGQFNALLAGGAYALSYVFDSATTDADPGPGVLRLSSATQNAATVMRLDVQAGGSDVSSILDQFDASTSDVKGSIRLVKVGDPSKWLVFDVMARAAPSGYRNLTVVNRGGSSASPFTNGDGLLLFFQRAGDRGEAGYVSYLKVSDRRAANTPGGSLTSGTQTRALNTVDWNDIAGASLGSASDVTLPAGRYEAFIRAPAFAVGGHQAWLRNTTDSIDVLNGSIEYALSGTYNNQSNSIVTGQFIITAPKVFLVRHYCTAAVTTNGGGVALALGQPAVFTEAIFKKVANA